MRRSIKFTQVSLDRVRGEQIPSITIQDKALYESLYFEGEPLCAVITKDYIFIQKVEALLEKDAITYK